MAFEKGAKRMEIDQGLGLIRPGDRNSEESRASLYHNAALVVRLAA